MVAAFAIMGLFLVWPLVTTFSHGFSGYPKFFGSRPYRDSLWNTLIQGGAVTVTSMVVGGALAVLVARCQFRFAGWVAHAEVPAFLNLADIVVMMSDHETQSLVCLEAQACGRLLLASDVPGAREVVRHGETGVLYRTGDVDDLAAGMVAAAAAPAWRAEVGQRARAAVAAHAVSQVAARYEQALERCRLRARQPLLG